MRITPLILTVLLALQLGMPFEFCRTGESCHAEEVHVTEADAAHHGCATTADQEQEKEDCQDDCSCSCCRVLINVYEAPVELAEATGLSPRRPAYKRSLHLLDLGPAIWEPPQVA